MGDENEITNLVHAYARLLDAGDIDAVSDLFEHSTWRSTAGSSVLRGAAAVRPVYEQLMAELAGFTTKHLITNLSVEVGPDTLTASSHCYWTVLRVAEDGRIEVSLSGRYEDAFEKVEGRWRFADRLISVDLGGDVGDRASTGAR